MEPNTDSSLFDLKIEENCKEQLKGLTTWAKIVVITSVISLVIGLIGLLMPKKTVQYGDSVLETERGTSIGGYIFTVIISLLLAYFLYQFSVFTRRGVDNLSQPDLNRGLNSLKSYFMTYGILIIIVMVVVFLMLLILGGTSLSR